MRDRSADVKLANPLRTKAIVATAAKMLKIIWFMLVSGEVYHGFDAKRLWKVK